MFISTIVTTYNRPLALARVLEGLLAQNDKNFEVIVADDGSREATRDVIEAFKREAPFPIAHVWQPDLGFRVGRCRNLAVKRANGDYLVFLDGDCIPRRNFISQHRLLSEKDYLVAGNRCLLSEALTRRIEAGSEDILSWGAWQFVRARLKGEINRLDALLTLPPMARYRYKRMKKWEKTRTCNMGVFRDDFLLINGFDSSLQGWGFEDSDFAARLINAGKHVKMGTFATAVFHLWHPRGRTEKSGPNWDRLQQVLANKETQPLDGFSRLIDQVL